MNESNNSNESKQVQMNNNGVQQTTDLNSMFAINNINFSDESKE